MGLILMSWCFVHANIVSIKQMEFSSPAIEKNGLGIETAKALH
jgi:hypothetical protein